MRGGARDGADASRTPRYVFFTFLHAILKFLQLYLTYFQPPPRRVMPQEDGNERRGSKHISSPQVRFFFSFLHTILMFYSFISLLFNHPDEQCHRKTETRGGARDASRDPRYVFFCFFTYYTNVSAGISHFFQVTVTSNATGGRIRGEGFETCLEPPGTFFFGFHILY